MNLAVGFIDGVHLGHRRILARADEALTFSGHPLSVLAPDRAPPLLMTEEERMDAIRAALKGGAGRVRALPFTRELAAEAPDAFAARLMRDCPGLETVYCGPNWTFGAGGAGDAAFLRSLGLDVEVVPLEMRDGAPISSTRIRAALAAGDVPAANAMLGRPFAVRGAIEPGKGIGRTLGFPTVNVRPANVDLARLLPLGVYAVETDLGGGVANWGRAPTMGEDAWAEPVMEVHALEGAGGRTPSAAMEVRLVRFLRPERRFATVEELRRQIAKDVFSASHSPQNRL